MTQEIQRIFAEEGLRDASKEARLQASRYRQLNTDGKYEPSRSVLFDLLNRSKAAEQLRNIGRFFTKSNLDPSPQFFGVRPIDDFTWFRQFDQAILVLREEPTVVERSCAFCCGTNQLSLERSLYAFAAYDIRATELKRSEQCLIGAGFKIALGLHPAELEKEFFELPSLRHLSRVCLESPLDLKEGEVSFDKVLQERFEDLEKMDFHQAETQQGEYHLSPVCHHCNYSSGRGYMYDFYLGVHNHCNPSSPIQASGKDILYYDKGYDTNADVRAVLITRDEQKYRERERGPNDKFPRSLN